MKTISLIQGTPEWHAHRAKHWNASDAPAMMGCSPYMTRTELLNRLHTGITPEVGPETQRRFDDGHRFEALARPLAEAIIGEELYPVTGVEGRYSASFDGLTMLEDVAFEHKTLNASLSELVWLEDANDFLPMQYLVQMEHQAIVSGCERILFMASKWRGDELVEERHCWYTPDAELRAKIRAGWAQLEADLASYVPSVAEVAKPTGRAPNTLPALHITVKGEVQLSNIDEFREVALGAIRSVNRDLTTDQDFADAEQSVKWCEEVESRLKAAKEHALSQTASIDALFKTIDDISAEARKVRLELDNLVKARKEAIRVEISVAGQQAFRKHLDALNKRLGGQFMIDVPYDFISCCRSKRTVASLRDAVDTELARAKIAANDLADLMEANIKTLRGEAHDWGFLFPDLATVASKPAEDFANLLAARIKTHQDAEATRKAREAEAAAQAAQVVEKAAAAAVPQAQAAINDAMATGTGMVRMSTESVERIAPETVRDTGATIKLGDINARLAPIQISADGLASLGFEPVSTERNAKHYRESDLRQICLAISNHMLEMADELPA